MMHNYNPPKLDFVDSQLAVQPRYESIMSMLTDYECIVIFKKVNGDYRSMKCSLREDIMPPKAQVIADELTGPETINYETITVWCTDKLAWRTMKTMNVISVKIAPKTWTITVEEDPDTKDLILPLPADLLELHGWKDGDTLEWVDQQDGSWMLVKVD